MCPVLQAFQDTQNQINHENAYLVDVTAGFLVPSNKVAWDMFLTCLVTSDESQVQNLLVDAEKRRNKLMKRIFVNDTKGERYSHYRAVYDKQEQGLRDFLLNVMRNEVMPKLKALRTREEVIAAARVCGCTAASFPMLR